MRWQDIADEKEKYAAYLCSREWAEKREVVKQRAGGKCERCRKNPIDVVHHLTYARKYEERPEDLQGQCQGCHDFTHGRSDADPAAAPQNVAAHWEEILPGEASLKCPICGEQVQCDEYRTDFQTKRKGTFRFWFKMKCYDGHWFQMYLTNDGLGNAVRSIARVHKVNGTAAERTTTD